METQPLAVELEMRREAAGGLRLAALRLEEALAELRDAEAAFRGARIPRGDDPRTQGAKRHAEHRLWCLFVQREAMGLRRHDVVYEVYGVPRSLVPKPG